MYLIFIGIFTYKIYSELWQSKYIAVLNKHPEQLIQQLIKLRELTAIHLPIGHSFIPYDILLVVVEGSISNNQLTVKALFTTLPYSDMGLRYHYRRLVDSGWIEVKPSSNDKRSKALVPTLKLLEAFKAVDRSLAKT